jgi:hypothetical protein
MTVGDIRAALAHEDDATEVFAAELMAMPGSERTVIGAVLALMERGEPTRVLLVLGP